MARKSLFDLDAASARLRLNLSLLLGIRQPRLNDSIRGAAPRSRTAEAIHREAGEHRQHGDGGKGADAGASNRAECAR